MNRTPSRAVALALATLVTVSLLAGVNRLATTQAATDARLLSAAPATMDLRDDDGAQGLRPSRIARTLS